MPSPCVKRLTICSKHILSIYSKYTLSLSSFIHRWTLKTADSVFLWGAVYLGLWEQGLTPRRPTTGGTCGRGLSPRGGRLPRAPGVQRTQKGPARSIQQPPPCSGSRVSSSANPAQRRPEVTKKDATEKRVLPASALKLRQAHGAAF